MTKDTFTVSSLVLISVGISRVVEISLVSSLVQRSQHGVHQCDLRHQQRNTSCHWDIYKPYADMTASNTTLALMTKLIGVAFRKESHWGTEAWKKENEGGGSISW
jgi:hypothetical protein